MSKLTVQAPMGVIYKLKPEIVEFIVRQKTDHPALSCRLLVFEIKDRFQCDISKSSINNVMKEAQLSSPVGRRALSSPKKKFVIPEEKRKRLFDKNLKEKFRFEEPLPKKKVAPADPQALKPTIRMQASRPLSAPAMSKDNLQHPPHRQERGMPAAPLKGKAIPAIHMPTDKGIFYDGMGCFFLKAAEWMTSDHSIMGKVLSGYIPGYAEEQIASTAEVLLYLEAFGIKEPTEIIKYQHQGLWVLNRFKGVFDFKILINMLEEIKDIKNFNVALFNDVDLAFKEASGLKITLGDKAEFFIDANFVTPFDNIVQTGLYRSSHQTVKSMSKQIINNIIPTILLSVASGPELLKSFFELICAYELLPGKEIKKITIVDSNGQDMVHFTVIPQQRRYFIIGAWPWQDTFRRFERESADLPAHHYHHPILDKDVYYTDIYSNFLNDSISAPLAPLRVILIKETRGGPASLALLTNFSVDKMSSDSIVYQYLLRWPNLHRSHTLSLMRRLSPIPYPPQASSLAVHTHFTGLETTNLQMNFRNLFFLLTEFCKRHFFPFHYNKASVAEITTNCYALPGFLKETPQFIIVRLKLPSKDFPFKEDLEFSVKRINEEEVLDPQGRRLLMFVEDTAL